MLLYFIVAIGTLLVAIVDVFLGGWVATLVALFLWILSCSILGNGIDWDRRFVQAGAYATMTAAAACAVGGFWFR